MPLRRRILRTAVAAAVLAAATAVGAVPAQASSTICVALVVDFGDLGGGVHSSCATVHTGATGYDVLEAGGHTFSICSNGVLGSIDGKPADGCQQKNDSIHYWSYWHRAPGSNAWTYSNEGAGTYQPRAGATEGWHWTKSAPANVPYDQICTPSPSPSPRPTHTSTTTAAPKAAATPTAAATTDTSASSTTRVGRARATAPRAHRHAGATTRPTTRVLGIRDTATPTASPAASATARVVSLPTAPRSDGSPVGRLVLLVAAVFVVAAVGGTAWWRARQGRTLP